MRADARLVAFLLPALLAGCAAMRPAADAVDTVPVRPANAIAFDLLARVAVTAPGNSETFTLRWQRREQHHQLQVLSPLGTMAAELIVDPGRAELRHGDNQSETDTSPEALLARVLGVRISLDQLALWLHGQPREAGAPGAVQISADGWTATVELGDNAAPRRFDAVRGQGTERTRLRLVVDEYRAY